uniref:Uncharacterized protein n=1 Tax=Aegilops tauschii subsp. strangulata TaxID=200361 RepID=A0A453QSC0_AEGTS
ERAKSAIPSCSSTMQQPATNIAPHTQHPPPSLAHAAGARSRATYSLPGHPVLLSRHSYRSRHVEALAVHATCSQGISNGNVGQDIQLRTDKFFELEMTVHDSELDQYGVVHNAISRGDGCEHWLQHDLHSTQRQRDGGLGTEHQVLQASTARCEVCCQGEACPDKGHKDTRRSHHRDAAKP